MHLNCNLYLKFNAIVWTLIAYFCELTNGQNCTIGDLTNTGTVCRTGWTCQQWSPTHGSTTGRCVYLEDNYNQPNKTITASTVKPLPIYSNDNNDNQNNGNGLVIMVSVFGALITVATIVMVYYMAVRRRVFHGLWRRAFTSQQIEHQLLDRSPHMDDINDSEAIA